MKVLPFRRPTRPYAPDPRNGEVFATESFVHVSDDVEPVITYAVIHISRSGDSFAVTSEHDCLEEAEAEAICEARRRNAVLS